jgi:hypothetical protein
VQGSAFVDTSLDEERITSGLPMIQDLTERPCAEAAPGEKSLIIAEYKKALTLYLGSVLSRDKRLPK